LSDEEKKVHELYDTWQLKEKEGKEYFGTVRSTFIIDESGKIIKEYRSVNAEGHAKKILNFIENYEEKDG
jgi:peroxiredoxin Q/BCP